MREPVDNKIKNFVIAASLAFGVTWALVVYAFHLKAPEAAALAGFVPIVTGFSAAYWSQYTPRVSETVQTVLSILSGLGYDIPAPEVIVDASQPPADHLWREGDKPPPGWGDRPLTSGEAANLNSSVSYHRSHDETMSSTIISEDPYQRR